MKLKVGDKVRIREDLILGEEYGNDSFVEDMEEFRGEEVTIRRIIDGTGQFFIEEVLVYCFTEEMIEKNQ
jgi:hypothetical protein